MATQELKILVSETATTLKGRAVDADEHGGWLMQREGGHFKHSRAIKRGAEAGAFGVDAARMNDVKGSHHFHTTGAIEFTGM